jgi:uncharacterized protein
VVSSLIFGAVCCAILSLALAIAVVRFARVSTGALGLRLLPDHAQLAWLALLGFVIWGAALGFVFKPGAPDAETLAFQATMPGLAEEFAYRGIAPALLLGLVQNKPSVEGMPWSVVLATSLTFGL